MASEDEKPAGRPKPKAIEDKITKPVESAKRIEPLTVRMFLGMARVENPLPSWHVIDEALRENNQSIVCTTCWSQSLGGTVLHDPYSWHFECRCKNSHRNATLERSKRNPAK